MKKRMREVACAAAIAAFAVPVNVWASARSRLDTPSQAGSIVGAWTLNKELSDKHDDRTTGGDSGRRGGGYGRGGGGFGQGHGGGSQGHGGGMGRGGHGDREEMARAYGAMRAIMETPERLTITQTETLVIITTGEGLTTRLSPDGKKIKDESTGIERKTKWDGGKLVSEITGIGPGKITETYSGDREQHRLTVTLQMEHSSGPPMPPMNRVYDAEGR